MRITHLKFAYLCTFVIALLIVPSALAQCGLPTKQMKPAMWRPSSGQGQFVRAALIDGDPAPNVNIIGFWHVIFTAQTSNGNVIPGGAVIDNALAVWHSDKTEIMNSIRPPQDGNFCLGVWKQTGQYTYYLNHYAWFANAYPTNPPTVIGPPSGPTHFTESVTLSHDGNHFTGTFTLDAFDTSGNIVQSFTGTLQGTRITTDTNPSQLF